MSELFEYIARLEDELAKLIVIHPKPHEAIGRTEREFALLVEQEKSRLRNYWKKFNKEHPNE